MIAKHMLISIFGFSVAHISHKFVTDTTRDPKSVTGSTACLRVVVGVPPRAVHRVTGVREAAQGVWPLCLDSSAERAPSAAEHRPSPWGHIGPARRAVS